MPPNNRFKDIFRHIGSAGGAVSGGRGAPPVFLEEGGYMSTYKQMPDFVLENIGEDHVLIKVSKRGYEDLFVYVFNDPGAFIWQNLAEQKSRDQLVKLVTDKYGIACQQAEADVDSFLAKSITEGFISEIKEGNENVSL